VRSDITCQRREWLSRTRSVLFDGVIARLSIYPTIELPLSCPNTKENEKQRNQTL
jgi:hypothetical protein